jgi:hypothetical protein
MATIQSKLAQAESRIEAATKQAAEAEEKLAAKSEIETPSLEDEKAKAKAAAASKRALVQSVVQLRDGPRENVQLVGTATIPMSTFQALGSKLHSSDAMVSAYVQCKQLFQEAWNRVERNRSLQTFLYAGLAALDEQLKARVENRPVSCHTSATASLPDARPLTLGMGSSRRPESSGTRLGTGFPVASSVTPGVPSADWAPKGLVGRVLPQGSRI